MRGAWGLCMGRDTSEGIGSESGGPHRGEAGDTPGKINPPERKKSRANDWRDDDHSKPALALVWLRLWKLTTICKIHMGCQGPRRAKTVEK